MNTFMRKCLAMGFIAAFLVINPKPAKATTVVEAELAILVGKANKLESLTASGSCATCAGSLSVVKAALEKLILRPDLKDETTATKQAVLELKAKLDELDRKIDALPTKKDLDAGITDIKLDIAKVPAQTKEEIMKALEAKWGPTWEAAARKPIGCGVYVDAIKEKGADAVIGNALKEALMGCISLGKLPWDALVGVNANGGVVRTDAFAIVVETPKFPASSGRTFAGWAGSIGGAAFLGCVGGAYVGTAIKPIDKGTTPIDWGGTWPGCVVGSVVIGALGGFAYAGLTNP